MMHKELDNVIVGSNIIIDYFDEIINYIKSNEKEILNFFSLSGLKEKYQVKILDYKSFKEFELAKYACVKDYVRGDTDVDTRTIRIMDLNDQRKFTTHTDANLDEMLKMIMHEFVHACNDEAKMWVRKTLWFYEGLATNLAHQDYEITDLETCDFEKLEWNFNGYGSGSYSYAYTIVNYLLNNYSHEEVMYFVKEPDYLMENSKTIFNQAKEWAKKMKPQR